MAGPALAVLVLVAVAACGLWLGRDWLRRGAGGGRRQPMVLGAHILLGLAAFETLIVLMHGLEEGPARMGGQVALGLMALALGLGLGGPLLAKDDRGRRGAMLAGHAGLGMAGILMGIAWAAGL
jgi:hypothetical protein